MQFVPVKTHNLNKLQQCLNYELGGTTLFILSYYYFGTLLLAVIAAIVLIPLLLRVLIEQKRFGWMISFFVFVIVPPLYAYLFIDDGYWTRISLFISIAFFYIYCAFLRFIIGEWIK